MLVVEITLRSIEEARTEEAMFKEQMDEQAEKSREEKSLF
jgi:hypothetical protein